MKQALAPGLGISRQGWGAAVTSAQKAVLENVHVIVERKDPVFMLQSFIRWKTSDARGRDSTTRAPQTSHPTPNPQPHAVFSCDAPQPQRPPLHFS